MMDDDFLGGVGDNSEYYMDVFGDGKVAELDNLELPYDVLAKELLDRLEKDSGLSEAFFNELRRRKLKKIMKK